MKYNINKTLSKVFAISIILSLASCTDKFEEFNTANTGLSQAELNADFNYFGGLFPTIQDVFSSRTGTSPLFYDHFIGGTFGGYLMSCYPNERYANYQMNMPAWEPNHLFNIGYSYIMTPINEIERRGTKETAPDFWAIARILKVEGMNKVTDYYGPIPYSEFGQGGTSVAYDKQEDIYDSFFNDLDSAVIVLKQYIEKYPTATPFQNFDLIYSGDYYKWIRFANTLRLRLAMRIVKVNPEKAKLNAEKAVAEGVMTANKHNAFVKLETYSNTLPIVTLEWVNVLINASIITYMDGYNDPRLPNYFKTSEIPGYTDKYVGIRNGADIVARQVSYSNLSPNFADRRSPLQKMIAAEAYFLRAEGALRGWNMGGGTAKEFYETGIRLSMEQHGINASSIDQYTNDENSKPNDYIDPIYPINSISALTDVTIKWDEGESNERKLEKIITQNWIASFPEGMEAWATFRRTGYPKLFPVQVNNSSGRIDTEIQIRRQPYPINELNNNPTGYATGIAYLNSEKGASAPGETTNTGEDIGGTRLWWDIGTPNF